MIGEVGVLARSHVWDEQAWIWLKVWNPRKCAEAANWLVAWIGT